MNIKKVSELVELMSKHELTEIEIDQEGMKIRLIKKAQGIEQIITSVPVAAAQPVAAAPAAQAPAPVAEGSGKEVKAPMVGTFYRSASPEEPPYVNVGDVIKTGAVLCIVEAMKLMNEVKAEFGGKVVEICVDNAEPVEFGQVMFKIEPM